MIIILKMINNELIYIEFVETLEEEGRARVITYLLRMIANSICKQLNQYFFFLSPCNVSDFNKQEGSDLLDQSMMKENLKGSGRSEKNFKFNGKSQC